MKQVLYFLVIMILVGCKKESDDSPDYSCNCQPNGKNGLSLLISSASSLYPFQNDQHRYGYLDENGDIVISPQFAGTFWFSNHRGLVIDDKNGMQFAGFIDETGNYVIDPLYHYLLDVYYSSDGLFPVINKDQWLVGYIDNLGQQRVPYLYDNGSGYHEGVGVVLSGDSVGGIDVNGNVVVPLHFEILGMFSEGLAFAKEFGSKMNGYIDKTGTFKFRFDFSYGGPFMFGLAPIRDNSGKYGYINQTGTTVIPVKYDDASVFSENLAAVKYEGKWGFITTSGSWAIQPQFDDIGLGFCNGLAAVRIKGQGWGYINQEGSFKIPCQFDEADVFYCNLAKVKFTNATYGYVNKKGEIVYHSKNSLKGKQDDHFLSDHLKKFITFAAKE
jgi:hypothetical protein